MSARCPQCDDTGFVISDMEGPATAARCACRRRRPGEADLRGVGLPRRYLHCTLDNYKAATPHQREALHRARRFVEDYPAVERGILFTGNCGVGKTHLAAAILRQLVLEQAAAGVFVDYQDLLRRLQATYSRQGPDAASEEQVLGPVLDAELLVVDDLGARRPSAWVQDVIEHLLTVRYNEQRPTLLTTNLFEADEAAERRHELPGGYDLLQDRVGERVFSRLHEMCVFVRIEADDHRRRPAAG